MNTADRDTSFTKVVRIGTVRRWMDRAEGAVPVYCKITWAAGKLSITGVEGPRGNGDCYGSCGQIDMHLTADEFTTWAAGWGKETCTRFLSVWGEWHLNDMRPYCEHQKALWGDSMFQELTLYHFKRKTSAYTRLKKLEEEALKKALVGEVVEITDADRLNIATGWGFIRTSTELTELEAQVYELEKTETKKANWVNPTEHPLGVLGKECPECGYRYGSKWLKQDVPDEVLEFLRSLPDTDKQPAWV